MQPYPNQNYYSQYMPQYGPIQPYQQQYGAAQPYMDRLAQLQNQAQQQVQQPTQSAPNYINGKIVDSLDVVKATDIPMDGNMYYFPKADGSEMYAKHWLPNGTTEIITYKPQTEKNNSDIDNTPTELIANKNDAFNDFSEGIMKRFDSIENRFDKLEKSIITPSAPKAGATRSKKEESEQ